MTTVSSDVRRPLALEQLRNLGEQIVRELDPERVILFGSYAYGSPRPDSDVDLLVVLDYDASDEAQEQEMLRRAGLPYFVQVFFKRPDDLVRRYREYDPIIREALDRGKALYERSGAGRVLRDAEDEEARPERGLSETVREFLRNAEDDHRIAERELRVTTHPSYGGACFHSQQCAEKALKALLIHSRVLPPRTHDLEELSERLAPQLPTWSWDLAELQWLSPAAWVFRYGARRATLEEARRAFDIASRLCHRVLSRLGEEP